MKGTVSSYLSFYGFRKVIFYVVLITMFLSLLVNITTVCEFS